MSDHADEQQMNRENWWAVYTEIMQQIAQYLCLGNYTSCKLNRQFFAIKLNEKNAKLSTSRTQLR